MMDIEKENVKKEVWFAEDVEKLLGAGMMCTIDRDTFFSLQRMHGLETLVHGVLSQTMILSLQCHQHQQVDSRKLGEHAGDEKREALHQCSTS